MTNHETIRQLTDQLEAAHKAWETAAPGSWAGNTRQLLLDAASLINDLCREAGVVMEEAVVVDPNTWYGD